MTKLLHKTLLIAYLACLPAYGMAPQAGAGTKCHAIEACFTPEEDCLPKIVDAIHQAEKSILVMAYYITQPPIIDALIDAHHAGLRVEVVMDKSQLKSRWSGLNKMKEAGIPCFIDKKPRIQHNKLMIIDGKVLLTGSYNWSKSAEKRNAENILFVQDDPALMERYNQYFEGRKRLSIVA